MALAVAVPAAHAGTITVRFPDGTPTGQAISTGFRYTIEEDRTFDVIPGCTGITPTPSGCSTDTLSLSFHRSYMPVVVTGETAGPTLKTSDLDPPLDATKRYFISILPKADGSGNALYSMGGAPLRPVNGAFPDISITVDAVFPDGLKPAQISVFLFNDDNPINNAPDAPPIQERGLCGFEVHLYDAGGTYGASGGRIYADAFGNPLGTTYNGVDAKGNPIVADLGSATLKTDANGVLRIRNLAPAKYTIFTLPPLVQPTPAECPLVVDNNRNIGLYATKDPADGQIVWGKWKQTATIEGTWGVDAWVKSGEPSYFKEFGPPGHHVFIGYVKEFNSLGAGGSLVTGQVVNVHMSRPPSVAFFNGEVVDQCWVGLNEVAAGVGAGRGVYAGPCNPDGTFSIGGLVPGRTYQLAIWDDPLDQVFASYNFVTPGDGGPVALNQVPVFRWFGTWQGKICHDVDGNGFCADDEPGVPGQAVNLRFRDGSIYQSSATDDGGHYALSEIFPFFNWMVAEVDFARFKATGVTVVVDAGGAIPPHNAWDVPSDNKRTPQLQADTNLFYRSEGGVPVLAQGMQTFLGTNNRIDWGKQPYAGNENGGISGIVYYASTRAEGDPRFTAGENNEPGIPGVTVRLYRADPTNRKKIMDVNGDTKIDANDAVAEATTDSWDASPPEKCGGSNQMNGVVDNDACYDGLRNYNQVRPAVFDGGYAFVTYTPTGINSLGGSPKPLDPGNYIVEVVPPVGYEIQKEEDKNVDFGDSYAVAMQALPPECVGSRAEAYHESYLDTDGVTTLFRARPAVGPVPVDLTLFPGVAVAPEYRDTYDVSGNIIKARPYCNRLAVTVVPQANPPANFYLFTRTPVAGHIVGMILDDLANEFSPYSPNFGEKYAPPFMPVSLRDQAGREFSRVYSDRFGNYNALVPSTFTYNVPMPSGVSPNMVQACLNSPYMPNAASPGGYVLDPHFNKSYTQFCYTFQYLPGKTTYLDTPVLPIAAFAGPQQYPLDCEAPTLTPAIASVTNTAGTGPYLSGTGQLTITSIGPQDVLNPLYNMDNPAAGPSKVINRDYGFGATQGQGTVTIRALVPGGGSVDVTPTIDSWTDKEIKVTVTSAQFTTLSSNAHGGGTLLVTRSEGKATQRGVFVHTGGPAPAVVGRTGTYATIQAAIDATPAGGLVTVQPGLYEESVIINKRVRVQGFGAGSTLINAVKIPTEKQQQWRDKVCSILFAANQNGAGYLLPGQEMPANRTACETGDTVDNAPLLFGNEEGAGFFVMVKDVSSNNTLNGQRMRIDGFTISGADQGGGVMVNGHARRLQISNNRITGNQGIEAGGIRIGHSSLTADVVQGGNTVLQYVDAGNRDIAIHHNEVVQNGDTAGATSGGGGGIALFTGSHGYRVTDNFVCGNYSTGDGGGIAHIGLSTATPRNGANNQNNNGLPRIERNRILYNQSFNQGTNPNGGGIAITGLQQPNVATGQSAGTGSVLINANTIQGNLAGAGDGGGISLYGVNGAELPNSTNQNQNQSDAHRIDIVNNVIVNNVAGVAGGGIALQDAVSVRIVNNTIAHNDSTATGARALASPSLGVKQPGAGIAARTHGGPLAALIGGSNRNIWDLNQRYHSNPLIRNSIVYENRMFHWVVTTPAGDTGQCTAGGTNTCYGLVADGYSDIAVIGGAYSLTAGSSLLTGGGDPIFVANYFNGPRDAIIQQNENAVVTLSVAAALDEGGNFIDTRFGPLTPNCPYPPLPIVSPYGDYRINTLTPLTVAPAYDPAGNNYDIAALATDISGLIPRPASTTIGAYQLTSGPGTLPACSAPAAAVAAN